MRIDDGNRTHPAAAPETTKLPAAGQIPADQLPSADQADVSKLAQAVVSPDEAGEKRLEGLRTAITNGTYRVASSELAANVIEFYLKADQ